MTYHESSGSPRRTGFAKWQTSPGSRQRSVVPDFAPLDPEALIRTLAKHRVQYVLIGALGARMYGFPRVTADADITPNREPANVERLVASLRELEAKIYTDTVPEGLAFDCTPAMLARADTWNLVTRAGRLDLAFVPSGTKGYAELAPNAAHFAVFDADLLVARLEDILRSKAAADRPKDRQDVLIMREMLARRRDADHS